MKKKLQYEVPATQVLELAPGGAILTGSQQVGNLNNPDALFNDFEWE